MYMNDVYTIPASMTGLPAVSVPCGFSANGLPIGLQLIGRTLDESTLLRAAHAYEQATPWRERHPSLA
jgi:aspartyl-tRNA(Asn)/glutamyl-tRNA(Gln) amidotransferase subunit A